MITPKGFFKDFLQTQMSGLTGNIGIAGYPFSEVEWGADDYLSKKVNEDCTWWPYEQTGYWLDGYLNAGILLGDKAVIDDASRIIYNAINKADADGYIGPAFMKNGVYNYRWAHVVFFRACISLYDYNKDKNILDALKKHYLNTDFVHSWARDVINVEIMCLLYERTGDYALIERAEKDYLAYNEREIYDWKDDVMLSAKKPFVHGVTYNEMMKLSLLLFKYTGKERYKKVALSALNKIEKFFMLPGGIPNSDEYMEDNYYYRCYETCDITDFTWALSYYLKVFDDAKYGDMIEKCIFNAGVGSVLENFKGLQYMSSANQFILANNSCHCECYRGNQQMSYRPNPFTECCPGNVNRFMPNYIKNMWQTDGDKVFLRLFGASEYQTKINDKAVTIKEETNFPFGESFTFDVKTTTPFKLYIRKPNYISNFNFDGIIDPVSIVNGYFVIDIVGDTTFSLVFDSKIQTHYVKGTSKHGDGVYFSKGLFVYALGQKGRREVDLNEVKQSKDLPALNIYPDKEWGYGVQKDVKLAFTPCDNAKVFDLDYPMPSLTIKGFKIANAKFLTKKTITRRLDVSPKGRKFSKFIKVKGDFVFTPDLLKTDNVYGKEQVLTLYPYGACKIRQTVFPIKK